MSTMGAGSTGKKLVRCIVCGAVFEEGPETCPICGVGKEYFVPEEEEKKIVQHDSDQSFVILGGGAAAVSAAAAIRERDRTCSITLVYQEDVLPYHRPYLTKRFSEGLLASAIAIHPQDWYEEQRIRLLAGKTVSGLLCDQKQVILSDGTAIAYDKCIYALGAAGFVPPIPGAHLPGVTVLRSFADAKALSDRLSGAKNAVVIGGGVLGLEAAWEFQKSGKSVAVIEMLPRLMAKQLDEESSNLLASLMKQQGIEFAVGASVDCIAEQDGRACGVRLKDGTVYPAELVVLSCGIRANTAIAKDAGLVVSRGIVVDQQMRTNQPDVFACGDCAEFHGASFGVWPEAFAMGEIAGANAAGDALIYQPFVPAVTFSGMDTSLYSAGTVDPAAADRVLTSYSSPAALLKFFFSGQTLIGVISIGSVSAMERAAKVFESKAGYQELFGKSVFGRD